MTTSRSPESRWFLTHFFALRCQFETRLARAAAPKPWTGQDIPDRTVFSPGEVDPWEYELDAPEGYLDEESAYSVGRSKYLEDCAHCDGRGTKICTDCHGKGTVNCGDCNGSGRRWCNDCNASGVRNVSCGSCSSGQVQGSYDSARGRYRTTRCGACVGSGTKKIRCQRCQGSKKVQCGGCGAMLETLEDDVTDAQHIAKQRLKVRQLDVYWVDYRFQEHDYKLLVHGDDDEVHAPWSPITKVRKDLIQQARASFESGDLVGAMRGADKAADMGIEGYEKKLPKLQRAIREALEKSIKPGAWLGMLVSAPALWFLSPLLFSNSDYIVLGFAERYFHEHAWAAQLNAPVMAGVMILLSLVLVAPTAVALAFRLTRHHVSSAALRFIVAGVLACAWVWAAALG